MIGQSQVEGNDKIQGGAHRVVSIVALLRDLDWFSPCIHTQFRKIQIRDRTVRCAFGSYNALIEGALKTIRNPT